MQEHIPLQKRLLKFVLALGVLLIVIYLARIPVYGIPAFKTYSDAVDKYDLTPGALYYSDVPVTFESEQSMRRAVQAVDEAHRQKRDATIDK